MSKACEEHLDKNAANHQQVTPLSFLERTTKTFLTISPSSMTSSAQVTTSGGNDHCGSLRRL